MKLIAKKPCSFGSRQFYIGNEIPENLVADAKRQEKMGVITIVNENIGVSGGQSGIDAFHAHSHVGSHFRDTNNAVCAFGDGYIDGAYGFLDTVIPVHRKSSNGSRHLRFFHTKLDHASFDAGVGIDPYDRTHNNNKVKINVFLKNKITHNRLRTDLGCFAKRGYTERETGRGQ